MIEIDDNSENFAVFKDEGDDCNRITHWSTYQQAKNYVDSMQDKRMYISCRISYRYTPLADYGKALIISSNTQQFTEMTVEEFDDEIIRMLDWTYSTE